MHKIFTLTIVALFAGLALAGCATQDAGPGKEDGSAPAPQAMVAASPLAPAPGETVTLEATGARAGDSVAWNFGDAETASGPKTTHKYAMPGQYIVTLSVTNKDGKAANNDASLTYITVTQAAANMEDLSSSSPTHATAASSAQVAEIGDKISFDSSGSGAWIENPEFDPSDPVQTAAHNPPVVLTAEGVTYAWNFGDGKTSSEAAPTHAYTAAGLYPVKLTVARAGVMASSYVISVRVLPEAPAATGVRNPTVLTVATIGEPESLDPAYDYEVQGGNIIQHVYDTLYFYQRDAADRLVPRVAAEMPKMSADGSELTIPIRKGVKFHNGDTLDAEDVKFALDRIILMNDPDGPSWIYNPIAGAEKYHNSESTAEDRAEYLAAGGVTVVDPYTVRIKLDYPDPAFTFRLAFNGASIVSKQGVCAHAEPDFVDCLPPPGETRHPWMDTHEVGSGPFTLEAWIPGQQVILRRYGGYWGEMPTLEKVIIQKVEDVNTRLLMLFSGQADDVYIPVDHDADVMNKPGVRVVENPSWTVSFMGFNQKFCGGPERSTYESCMIANGGDAPKGADGTPDPLFFSDINMRKAWTHAFDYETYLRDILKGHGRMLNGPLPKGIFGFDENIPAPERDLDKAREFLSKTKHANGFSITIFYNTGNTVREKTANLLAQNLRELGPNVNVEVRGLDWSTAFLPKQRAFALPVYYLGWGPDYAFPDNYVVTFAHSEHGVFAGRVGYENTDLNAKLDTLTREVDPETLKRGYSEAVKLLNEDHAFLWLAQSSTFHVEREWVRGYYYNPMHSGAPNVGDYTTISKR